MQPFEKEYFRKDGGRVAVLVGVASFEESENQGVSFVLDLTERKRGGKTPCARCKWRWPITTASPQ